MTPDVIRSLPEKAGAYVPMDSRYTILAFWMLAGKRTSAEDLTGFLLPSYFILQR